jgi:hypothetical protein
MTDQEAAMSQIEMTLSSSNIRLENGTGAVTASVTNAAAKPQRVVLRVFGGEFLSPPEPDAGAGAGATTEPELPPPSHRPSVPLPDPPPDPSGWATIEESLRTIPAGATEQYAVAFEAKSAPGGTYSVKLNAYSADEPPEANSGQVLTLQIVVPAQPVKPEPHKFPWWIVAVAAGLVVVIAVVVFFLWPRKTEVPLLTGGTLDQAQAALVAANLGGAFNPVESTEPPETVLSQDPEAGAQVEPESIVTIGFAVEQTVEVPSVLNQQAAAARSGLADIGLQVVLNPASTCNINDSACIVRGQLPEAGERVPVGSNVMLTISPFVFTFPWPVDTCGFVFCHTLEPGELGRVKLPDFGR